MREKYNTINQEFGNYKRIEKIKEFHGKLMIK